MTVTRRIISARHFFSHDHEGKSHSSWLVEYHDGQKQHAIGFPVETLAWRSAEYGIPHTDTETLMDLVLHHDSIKVPREHPKHLYNTDQETGRLHQLSLLQASRREIEYQDSDGLLEPIKQEHLARHHPVEHDRKTAVVEELRSLSMKAMGITR